MRSLLVVTFLSGLAISNSVETAPNELSWKHDWNTPASAWWGYGAMNDAMFSDQQVAFIAQTYKVVVLSMCVSALNISVADAVRSVSAKLKTANSEIKVLQYFNVGFWPCYQKNDPQYANFLAHPEYWWKDDNGNPLLFQNSTPMYDYSNEQAVESWLSMPSEGIDGFLFDGGAVYDQPVNVSSDRAEVQKLAMWKAIGRWQEKLSSTNGLVLANGMAGGPIDPHNNNDAFNLGVLDYANGIENERASPVFEYVDHTTGAFNKTKIAANLAASEQAGQLANGTKVVAMNYWAGPFVGFNSTTHQPEFALQDPINHAPVGTLSQMNEGWKKELEIWLPFNLAMFLTIAGPSTYFTHMVWYAASQGTVACPEAPDTCMAPDPFYPDMHKPLGAPLGPRTQIGPFKWQRNFEHAVVKLDLDDPLGPGTAILWNA